MKNNSNKGIQNNKHYLSRSVRWIVFIFIVGIGGYLTLPSNYYLRRALTHLLPKIDQSLIFENRVVQAGSPRPWELSKTIVASTVTPVISPASDNYYSTKDKNLFIKRSKNKRT